MAFDMGFNFRSTSGYVTDQSYAVPMLSEAYPNTYTNTDGYSINGGLDNSGFDGRIDRSNTNDPRIAGVGYKFNDGTTVFKVDLSSGSAPGAGTYTVDFAAGDAGNSSLVGIEVLDDTTMLIDGKNGGAGFALALGHYLDATLADVTASTTWTGATVSKTWATTNVIVNSGHLSAGSGISDIAHFRLTLAAVAAASLLPPPNRFAHMLVR